jgi:hypothetical protein
MMVKPTGCFGACEFEVACSKAGIGKSSSCDTEGGSNHLLFSYRAQFRGIVVAWISHRIEEDLTTGTSLKTSLLVTDLVYDE